MFDIEGFINSHKTLSANFSIKKATNPCNIGILKFKVVSGP